MSTLKFIVTPEFSGQRLDIFLANQTKQSRTRIQEHLKNKRVTLNSNLSYKVSVRIQSGDEVGIELLDDPPSTLEPVNAPLDIIFEDEHLLVLNKAQGVVVHPAAGHRCDTLVHHLLHYLGEAKEFLDSSSVRPGIVHRLDKGTSGVLLIAKNRQVQEALSQQFKNREVKKVYECIVWGQIKRQGTLRNAIGRDRIHRKKMSSKTSKGRAAETRFEPMETFLNFTHLLVFPLTGRTHQIRVHLSEFGHSIVGDPLYGKGLTAKRSEEISTSINDTIRTVEQPFLHASQLSFFHPVNQEVMEFKATPPASFSNFLNLLKRDNS
ncbi:MAG: RluA family pseudouridine synthase [Pseudomonadota bacterium]